MIKRRFHSKRRRLRYEFSPSTPELKGPPLTQGADRSAPKSARIYATIALLLMTLGSCTSLGRLPSARYQPPTTISATVTFAKSNLSPEQEARYLADAQTAAALLRRSWLELELKRTHDALDTSARVIFTDPPPSAHVEAFARYLRAEAYRRQGLADQGRFDRERALQLAMDPELKRRLEGALGGAATPGATAKAPTKSPWSKLTIQRRGAWQAKRENQRNLDRMQQPRRVTIHHSAMLFRSTASRAAATQIKQIQREHMNNRGYGDIGYHFLIDPSGRIWEGRQLRWQGAHASGTNNIANIGICLLGNFIRERNGQGPTRSQIRSMEQLVVSLMQHYRMRTDALFCHSDFKSTACPGPRMAPIVRQLARQLRARGHVTVAEEDED